MTLDPGARPGRYGVCDVHYPDAGGAVAALVVAADVQLGVPVVGVAKTRFHAASHAVEVRRGSATRPLYVTAAGMPAAHAAALVSAMAGPHRIPRALRRVDAIARRPELADVAEVDAGLGYEQPGASLRTVL
ncbi:hypothetical protein [Cellulomonas sp. NS3]|uniref:hypothetical protein n=1 Tax=Cellulomonas sp. NS3 TaxID=2973977 RepID=UPI002161BB3A|nr:hypothetical protein [Cellulomonas sp. NS3]